MPSVFDPNRGGMQARSPDGRTCNMYFDDPGVYFDNSGEPVDVKTAEAAGYEVEKWAKQKRKKDLLREAEKQAESEGLDETSEPRAARGRRRSAATSSQA